MCWEVAQDRDLYGVIGWIGGDGGVFAIFSII